MLNLSLFIFPANNSSALLDVPVVAFEDKVNNVYRIMPTPALEHTAEASIANVLRNVASGKEDANAVLKSDKISAGKPQKVPRPPNAFILYRQHHHPLVKAAHPEYHNNDICMSFVS